MKKTLCMLSITGLATFSTMAFAAADKPVAMWLCSDYLSVDESYQPTALGFAAAVNHDGELKEAVLNTEGIATIHPQVTEICNENPEIELRDALVQADGRIAQ